VSVDDVESLRLSCEAIHVLENSNINRLKHNEPAIRAEAQQELNRIEAHQQGDQEASGKEFFM
jgi:hypothetical protein